MRLYLAGPMRNYPMFNFPAFDSAALQLRRAGFDVVSPAELDRVNGVHEFSEITPAVMRDAMRRDLVALCDVDGVATLKGFRQSVGCGVELALANFLDLPVRTVPQWIASLAKSVGL